MGPGDTRILFLENTVDPKNWSQISAFYIFVLDVYIWVCMFVGRLVSLEA